MLILKELQTAHKQTDHSYTLHIHRQLLTRQQGFRLQTEHIPIKFELHEILWAMQTAMTYIMMVLGMMSVMLQRMIIQLLQQEQSRQAHVQLLMVQAHLM